MTLLSGLTALSDADLHADVDELRSHHATRERVAAARGDRAFDALLQAAASSPDALEEAVQAVAEKRRERRDRERTRWVSAELRHDDLGGMDDEQFKRLVEGARLHSAPSELSRRAVDDFVSNDIEVSPENARRRLERLVWYALNLDPPAEPTNKTIKALKQRAANRRKTHDEFVAAAGVVLEHMPELTDELEAEAALLRFLAVRDAQIARAAKERANEGPEAETSHRRARVQQLVDGLRVGDDDGWTWIDLARLILASDSDWTVPPCPRLVAEYCAHDESEGDAKKLADAISKLYKRTGRLVPQIRDVIC